MRQYLILTIGCFITFLSNAQINRPNVKFGIVKETDLATKVYSIDSNAQAVVLYDYGDVLYEGNSAGNLNVVYKYIKRTHLLNKNAFDLATIYIPLYKRGNSEDKLEKLEAYTYNLEGGKVVKTKIDKSSVFKDKVNKDVTLLKFTFPDLKEGSIIEYSYVINSPTPQTLRTWNFQESYPVLWSEYNTHVPYYYQFHAFTQGYNQFVIDSAGYSSEYFNVLFPGETANERAEMANIKMNVLHNKRAMQNLPALKKESFTTTISNHISKIIFQFAAYRPDNKPVHPVVGTWPQVAKDLLKDEEFGADLDKKNGWLEDDLKRVVAGETNARLKAKKVFEYVRDNFSCTSHDYWYTTQPLKKTFQTKKGNVAEINLLLTAMYKNLGLDAKPIILSTRDNGKSSVTYPLLNKFNYTICQVEIAGEKILVDASEEKIGFGRLPADCYNDYGRLIDENAPVLINLSADSILENKLTSVFIVNDEKTGLSGTFSSTLGYFESLDLREKLVKEKQDEMFLKIKKSYPFEIEMSNTLLDSLKLYDEPVFLKYDFKFNVDDDIIYFSPLLTEAYKENPFKSAKRFYPVEMPFTSNETYLLNMEIPKGYVIDELPKSARINFNDKDGIFEYIVGKVGNSIQLRCTLKMRVANFPPEDYDTLRDFYAYIVKKQSEQIVFKKIK